MECVLTTLMLARRQTLLLDAREALDDTAHIRRPTDLAQVALVLLVVPTPVRPVLGRLTTVGAVVHTHHAKRRDARLRPLLPRRAERPLNVAK